MFWWGDEEHSDFESALLAALSDISVTLDSLVAEVRLARETAEKEKRGE